MSESRRQKRLVRAAGRKPTSLNLTSLMDVFTILVFFLLVNSSSDAVIDNPKDFTLPASISDTNPDNNLELMIGVNEVLVEGNYVMSLRELQTYQNPDETDIVAPLRNELARRFQRARNAFIGEPTEADMKTLRSLTVIANREISYSEIKKVMASASDSGFNRISMAVLQKSLEK